MRFIDRNYRASSIAMLVNGLGFLVLYPKNLLVGQFGWIWDYPSRHLAFEHMLVAMYVTLGAFLIWGARDVQRFQPLIDYVIISGILHASVMAFDAAQLPGMHTHFHWRGDVVGTYFAPVVLTLFHPRWKLWRSPPQSAPA